jgi:hypothetical protein
VFTLSFIEYSDLFGLEPIWSSRMDWGLPWSGSKVVELLELQTLYPIGREERTLYC